MMKQISDLEVEDMALFCAYCGYCGEEISWKGTGKRTGKRTWKRRRIVHINICQEPSIIYFCNRDCKLDWIFKRPKLELDEGIKGSWINREVKSILDMAVIKDTSDELEKYLKDNNLRILRQA